MGQTFNPVMKLFGVLFACTLLVHSLPFVVLAGWSDCEVRSFEDASREIQTGRCTEIEVSHSGLLGSPSDPSKGFLAFLDALAGDQRIRKVELEDNDLGDEGVTMLIEALVKRGVDLYSLEISSNGITDQGASAIAAFLKKSTALRKLTLSRNVIGDQGAVEISKKFPIQLHEVDMSSNKISDEGAIAIVQTSLSSYVHEVELNYNVITDQGAKVIAETIQQSANPALRELEMKGNMLGPEGIDALERVRRSRSIKISSHKSIAGAGQRRPDRGPSRNFGNIPSVSLSPAHSWTEAQVKEWLLNLHPQFKKYAGAINNNAIDGSVLLTITDSDLKDIGIENAMHRRRIVAEVMKLAQIKAEL